MRSSINIDVYLENNQLYVKFNIFNKKKRDAAVERDLLENLTTMVGELQILGWHEMLLDSFAIASTNIATRLLEISPKQPNDINSFRGELIENDVLDNAGGVCFSQAIITYQLSTVPHILLNWIAYFELYLEYVKQYDVIKNIQFDYHTQFNKLKNIINFIASSNNLDIDKVILQLMEKLLIYKDNFQYKEALTDCKLLYEYYKEIKKVSGYRTLLQCLSDKTRYKLIYEEKFQNIREKNIYEQEFKMDPDYYWCTCRAICRCENVGRFIQKGH